jgi:hypothetical protein
MLRFVAVPSGPLEINFASIKGSELFIRKYVKIVVPYCSNRYIKEVKLS